MWIDVIKFEFIKHKIKQESDYWKKKELKCTAYRVWTATNAGYRNFIVNYLGLDCIVVKVINLWGIFLKKTKLSDKFEYLVHRALNTNHIEAPIP